jgi:hypothetical protein
MNMANSTQTPTTTPKTKRGTAPIPADAAMAKTPQLARHLGVTATFLLSAARKGWIPPPTFIGTVALWDVAGVTAVIKGDKQ